MPAVVRVKRRIDEETIPALVLNGKKRRLELNDPPAQSKLPVSSDGKDEISTVLRFAGTIQDQILTKEQARELVQQKTRGKPSSNHTERARAEMRQSLHESRFRVVNCLRSTLLEAGDNDDDAVDVDAVRAAPQELTIVDIERQDFAPSAAATASNKTNACGSQAEMPSTSSSAAAAAAVVAPPEFADSDTGYVYDLYLPENEQHAEAVDQMDDNYLSHFSCHPYDDLVYEDRFNNNESDAYDSEDSNEENQPGNEYPDEEDDEGGNLSDESEGTRQVRLAVENFVFDDDEDDDVDILSSEDEDVNPYQDPYVHSIDLDDDDEEQRAAFEDDCDVNRFGLAYARYKKRVLKRLKNGEEEGEDEDEEDKDGADGGDDGDGNHSDTSSSVELYHSASENESFNE